MGQGVRVAYFITSYKLPRQVLRLASVLRRGSPEAVIAIHHDDRQCSLDRAALAALGVSLIEPPSAVSWGDASQLLMVLRGLGWLLAHTDCDWVVLISGQDYPIKPVPEIEQALAAADVDAFIETRACDGPGPGVGIDEFNRRYHFQWRRLPFGHSRLVSAVASRLPAILVRELPTGTWIGVRPRRSPFTPELRCYTGCDWLTLSRTAVQAVDRFTRSRPDVLRYYRHTLIPTESFIQTILANDSAVRTSGDCRRFLQFEPGAPGPRILGLQDLDVILSSTADFARKFDETVDVAVLDELDRRIHSASPGRIAHAGTT